MYLEDEPELFNMPDTTPGISESQANGDCYDVDENLKEGYVELTGTYTMNGELITT